MTGAGAAEPNPHPDAVITTSRLQLRTMTAEFLEATLFGDLAQAEAIGGFTLSEDWPGESPRLLRHWIDALRAVPEREFWLARAIVLRGDGLMVGHIGCHDRPGAAYLEQWAPGANAVEIGYTVFAAHRGLGYATEAATGLMDWAWTGHGVHRFIASISPQHTPSLRVIAKLGFTRIGSHVDDVDGPEDVFEHR